MKDLILGGHYYINCPKCNTVIDYDERCKCGYWAYDEYIKTIFKNILPYDINMDEEYW